MLLSQSFVEGLGLFQVADQLLNFERGEDDKVADTGHLKRSLLHSHTFRRQTEPIDDPLEVRLHEEAYKEAHVLLNDGHFVAGAEQRGFIILLFLSVALTGSLCRDLELLWRASARAERRLLRLIRGRPEVSLMLIERRRGCYRSVGPLNDLPLLLLSQPDVFCQLRVRSILSTTSLIILRLLVVGPADI